MIAASMHLAPGVKLGPSDIVSPLRLERDEKVKSGLLAFNRPQ
jgi:hypothetical protein